MKVLGLDSATWTASVGVVDGDQILAEQSAPASTSHATSLLGLIESTLAAACLGVSDLDLLAVSIGPGSFTGLRVSVSVAKGLALATSVPVVGVSTLEGLAFAAGPRPGPICAALDARKGEMYLAAFRSEAGRLATLIEPAVVSLEGFLQLLPVPCTVVGDGVEAYRGKLESRLDPRIEVIPFTTVSPRGSVIAALGRRRFELVGAESLDRLEPAYVRLSEAEMQRRQGAVRTGGRTESVSRVVESPAVEQN